MGDNTVKNGSSFIRPFAYQTILDKNGFDIFIVTRLKKIFMQYDVKISFVAINSMKYQLAFLQSENFQPYNFLEMSDRRLSIISVDQIKGFELVDNSLVIEKRSSNFGKMIAGGLLFGGLGAIAGSLDQGHKNQIKTKSDVRVRLIIDDLRQASVDLKCDSFEEAYQLLHTLSLLEEKYYKNIPNKDLNQQKTNQITNEILEESNDASVSQSRYYDEIMKIKQLFDQGVINKEEFEILKKKIINS